MYSPYEFYVDQYTQELNEICEIFDRIIGEEKVPNCEFRGTEKEKFKWKSSGIDHYFRPNRYSPFFNNEVGIDTKNKKFLNRDEFYKKWDE